MYPGAPTNVRAEPHRYAAAIGVGSYTALAGLWGSAVSGASLNPARSLGPALVKDH